MSVSYIGMFFGGRGPTKKLVVGILKTTDEIVEGFHQIVNKQIMKGYHVKNFTNQLHGDRLFNLIRPINTYNLYISM